MPAPRQISDRHRALLHSVLHGDERRRTLPEMRSAARRGWLIAGSGGAYRLTAAGRALAERLEPPKPDGRPRARSS